MGSGVTCIVGRGQVVPVKEMQVVGTRRRLGWTSPLDEASGVEERVAESLTQALFSLAEPWRERFLRLVANSATDWQWNGRLPTREEVKGWLMGCPALYRHVRTLLDTWQGQGR